MKIPVKGETWEHTTSGRQYLIEGGAWNAITDKLDVVYRPLYPCEFGLFTRQLRDDPKSWTSTNEDGAPRFRKVSE
ncbi:hypothetical protein [Novosphingobium sp.]|uniref:hypothetical protein n=1 Tax=Novosphingobium sp. TaxID=1874826 RepID=UPI0028ABBFF6|nr:hypothetical protein [Novosphingobium sp.]